MRMAMWWRWLRIGRRLKGSCPDKQRHTENRWGTRAARRKLTAIRALEKIKKMCVCARVGLYPCIHSCCQLMWRCQWWPLNWACCRCQLEKRSRGKKWFFNSITAQANNIRKTRTVQNSPKEPYSYGEAGVLPVETCKHTFKTPEWVYVNKMHIRKQAPLQLNCTVHKHREGVREATTHAGIRLEKLVPDSFFRRLDAWKNILEVLVNGWKCERGVGAQAHLRWRVLTAAVKVICLKTGSTLRFKIKSCQHTLQRTDTDTRWEEVFSWRTTSAHLSQWLPPVLFHGTNFYFMLLLVYCVASIVDYNVIYSCVSSANRL